MRKVRLHPSQLLLRAQALGEVDHAHDTDGQAFDHARPPDSVQDINDAAVKCHQICRLLEGIFTTPPAFHRTPQGVDAFPPEPVRGIVYELLLIPCAEHADRVVVDLLDDERAKSFREKIRMVVDMRREIIDPVGAKRWNMAM